MSVAIDGYSFSDASAQPASKLLAPHLFRRLRLVQLHSSNPIRVFDLGCGNGAMADQVHKAGYAIVGVDPSVTGIAEANRAYPNLELRSGSAYDDLAAQYGTFDAVYSFEVVEHLYDPVKYAATLHSLTKPGGVVLVSTPYHGYTKNLMLAATGKLDDHFTALWVHGHIKFWSIKTLSKLLKDAGFKMLEVVRVGRVPVLAKSMLLVAERQ